MKRTALVISGLDLWNYGPRWEVFSRFSNYGLNVDYISPYLSFSKSKEISLHKAYVPLFNVLKGRMIIWFFFMFSSFLQSLRVARSRRPFIVYGYEIYGALPAFFLGKLIGVPVILRFQGTVLYPHLGKISILPFLLHIFAFKTPADSIIITNDGTCGDIVANSLRVPEDRVKFWFNGVDKNPAKKIDSLTLRAKLGVSSGLIVMSICRLADWKGVNRLIEAVPSVLSRQKDVYFIIIGDGEEKNALIQLAAKLNVKENVLFLGHIPHSDIASYLSIADVFVTLQDLSCLSASLMDAMISGRCIVALNTGDTQKVIKNGVTGVLLENSKPSSLGPLLVKLLDDRQLRIALGNGARKFAETQFWSWNERAEAEALLVDELIRWKSGK